jgi:hypothetical protein
MGGKLPIPFGERHDDISENSTNSEDVIVDTITSVCEWYGYALRTICGHFKDGGLTREQLAALYETGIKRYLRDKQIWFNLLGVKVDLGISPKSTTGTGKSATDRNSILTKFKPSELESMSDTEKATISEQQYQEHRRLISMLGSKELG